jgi:hypothetical protein
MSNSFHSQITKLVDDAAQYNQKEDNYDLSDVQSMGREI